MPDQTPTTRTLCRTNLVALVLVLGVLLALGGPAHAASPFAPGDLVLGLGSRMSILNPEGKLRHYAPDGTLIQTLLTTSGSIEETGPCFNAARNLFTTNFQVNSLSKFGANGSLLAGSFATGLHTHPNSCVFDRTGNLYVGLSDDSSGGFGNGALLKLDASGLVTASFLPLPDARGTDWIDLAGDQCTLYYTSLGASIKRFDVCTNTQLTDFCTSCDDGAGGTASGPFFALRLLPDGGLLVADWNNFAGGSIRRYDSSGAQIQSYSASDTIGSFFPWGVALDPDFTSFWAVDSASGQAFRFDLDSGSLLSSFLGGDCTALVASCAVTGLAIAGEPTVAAPPVVAHITADDKVYDGNASATVTNCYLTGVRPGDVGNVTCTAGSGAFDTASAGANKTVSAPVILADSSGGNYVLFSSTATTTASITPAPASVTPNPASKTYGTADPAFTGSLSGFLEADNVTATYSRTAGEFVAGSPYTISATLSPAAVLSNYAITYNTAAFTITPLAASATPNPATKVYGSSDPALTGALFGFLPASGISASFTRTAGENVAGSPYVISATLSPASALANYTVTFNTAAFTITRATPVVTWADPADIFYPTPLSGTQLNATANVPGSFVYSPAAGTILNVGNGQPLSVLFTPTDNGNYTTATAQVHINVLPAAPPQSEPSISLSKTANKSTATYGESVTYTYVVTNTGTVTLTNVTVVDDNGTPAYAADDFTVGTVASLLPGASVTFTKTVVPPAALCNPDTGHTCGSLVTQHRSDGTTKFTYLQSRDSRDNYSDGSGWSGSRSYSSKARFRVDGVDGVSSYVANGWQGSGGSSHANSFSIVVNRSVCTKSDGSVKPPAIYHKKGWNGDWSRDWDTAHGWTDRSNRWDDDHDGYNNDDDYDQAKQPRYCPSVTTNTATATGSASGTTVTATATASVSLVGPPSPAVSMNKSANKQSVAFGEGVTYTYVITNTGNVALTNVKVVDDNGTPSYAADDFTVGTVASLAPGATATFTRTLVPPTKMCRTGSYGTSKQCGTFITEHRGDGTTKFTYLQSKDQRDSYQGYGGWSGSRAYAHKTKFRVIDRTGVSSYDAYGALGSGDGSTYANAFSVTVNQSYVAGSDGAVMPPRLYHKKGWHDDWRQDWDRSHGWTDRTHNWDDDKWWRSDNDADYDYDSGPEPCASSSTNVAKVTATAGGVTVSATDKETVQIIGSAPHAGYVSYTQGGWGAKPYGNNPGRLLADHFAQLYPNGLVIGGTKTIKLTSAAAVDAFLPQGGTPAKLTQNYVNPTSQISVLAGQVLALKLNVDFTVAGFNPSGFATLKVADGGLDGMTVNSVLALGNSVLGGGTLPWGVSLSDLTNAISLINANFDGGTDDNGYLE